MCKKGLELGVQFPELLLAPSFLLLFPLGVELQGGGLPLLVDLDPGQLSSLDLAVLSDAVEPCLGLEYR